MRQIVSFSPGSSPAAGQTAECSHCGELISDQSVLQLCHHCSSHQLQVTALMRTLFIITAPLHHEPSHRCSWSSGCRGHLAPRCRYCRLDTEGWISHYQGVDRCVQQQCVLTIHCVAASGQRQTELYTAASSSSTPRRLGHTPPPSTRQWQHPPAWPQLCIYL